MYSYSNGMHKTMQNAAISRMVLPQVSNSKISWGSGWVDTYSAG
jgi:hypothetical protein